MGKEHICSVTEREVIAKSVAYLSTLCNGEFLGECGSNILFKNIWMDSRKIEYGDIFVALKGEVDGHDYVAQALENGAVAAIVEKSKIGKIESRYQDKLIVVENTLEALKIGARNYRRDLDIPFIAVTGSNGKSSTTHFLKEVLSIAFTVGSTYKNFNNEIGLPLSIFRLTGLEDIVVLEIGANHLGEIATLVEIAEPDMGIITNIGYAHIGEFGSIENTAIAKFELADFINKINGKLFINGDDRVIVEHNIKKQIPALYFGTRDHNMIRATDITCDKNGHYRFSVDRDRFNLSVAGKHFIYNALPAIAIAKQLHINSDEVIEKINSISPVNMRGNREVINGVSYIVDCYNSNPSSLVVATDLLVDIPTDNKKIAVIGDMFELGEYSDTLHRDAIEQMITKKIDSIITVGENFYSQKDVFNNENVSFVKTVEEASKELLSIVENGDTVLLKASRGIGLEKIFDYIKEVD